MTHTPIRVGIVGARGHTGAELIKLIATHPSLQLAFVSSRALAGQAVAAHNPDYRGPLCYQSLTPDAVAAQRAEVVVLALPNGKATDFVAAIETAAADTLLVDLSADHRFDPAWHYGLPELRRRHGGGQRRIANPGCYATAMALAIAPLRERLAAPPVCFGVSGYSGAGTTPSHKNNPDKLRDNLMPYALTGHIHEREASRQLGLPVEFMPHVAPHFRGLSVTCNLYLGQPLRREEVLASFHAAYDGEPLVQVLDEAPWLSRVAGRHHAAVGGFALAADRKRVVVVAALDNLLKGAATQAMQNINIALGLPELAGIESREPGIGSPVPGPGVPGPRSRPSH